ncbi:MAG: DUF6508 domain-containing protein [Roseburia sp.]|nr:DUF6508 domain-containing protein [Roseburia sp.]
MDESLEYRQKRIEEYKKAVLPLLFYLSWLEKNAGNEACSVYGGQGLDEHSMSFPVYDGTLMTFVREASESALMYKDYLYLYTRRNIKSHEDERRLIVAADLQDWDLLRGILSRYILGGRTKGTLWSEAVRERIFYLVLKRMKEIIEFWDKPLGL